MRNIIKLFGILLVASGVLFVSCKEKEVKVSGVNLNKFETTLEIGDVERLTVTVLPENADNKDVTWESSDKEVATVDASGIVAAIGFGKANITAKAVDGDKTATCVVTVVYKVEDTFSIEVRGNRYLSGSDYAADFSVNEADFNKDDSAFCFYHGSAAVYLEFTVKNMSDKIIPAGTPYKFEILRNGTVQTEMIVRDGDGHKMVPIKTEGKLEKDIAVGETFVIHKEDPFYVSKKVNDAIGSGNNICFIRVIQMGKKEYPISKNHSVNYVILKK